MSIIEPFPVAELHYDGVGDHFVVGTTLKYTFWTWQMVDGLVRKVAVMKLTTPYDLHRIETNVQSTISAFRAHREQWTSH